MRWEQHGAEWLQGEIHTEHDPALPAVGDPPAPTVAPRRKPVRRSAPHGAQPPKLRKRTTTDSPSSTNNVPIEPSRRPGERLKLFDMPCA